MSNLSPAWTFAKQEALLADALPGARVFRDDLTGTERMARDHDRMKARGSLLRTTTRKDPAEETIAAVPAVLDWTVGGFMDVVEKVHARGGSLRFIQPPMTLAPSMTARDLKAAADAFLASKKNAQAEAKGKLGGEVSGERREAEAMAKVAPHLDLWRFGDPEKYPTHLLLRLMGVSFNTAKKHGGPRKNAIRKPKPSRRKAKK